MIFFKEIHNTFQIASQKKRIINFRVFLVHNKNVSLGVTNKSIAGVYNPINISSGISGDCLIEWPDNLISSVSLSREDMNNFNKFLNDAKKMRYKDVDEANFLSKQKYKEVKLYDEEVADIVDGKNDYLFKLVLKLNQWQDKIKTKQKEINAYASKTESAIFTSQGLFESQKSTSLGYYSIYDNRFALEDTLIKIPEEKTLNLKKDTIEKFYLYFEKVPKIKPKPGKLPILLMPWISSEMFFQFIISNLAGSSVYNKISRFNLDDFEKHKKILREDLNLSCDPTIDFDISSYKFTLEGVDSKKTDFIKNGRLNSQVLDLKYAKKQNQEPTAFFSDYKSAILRSSKEFSFDKVLKSLKEGILVFNILGLHTQSSVTGDYSLPVPDALYIKKGKIVGKARAIIIGNIFEDMNKNDFRLIRFKTEKFPGFLIETNTVFETVK